MKPLLDGIQNFFLCIMILTKNVAYFVFEINIYPQCQQNQFNAILEQI